MLQGVYGYIGLVEKKQAHFLRKVSSGAMFENLKLGFENLN